MLSGTVNLTRPQSIEYSHCVHAIVIALCAVGASVQIGPLNDNFINFYILKVSCCEWQCLLKAVAL